MGHCTDWGPCLWAWTCYGMFRGGTKSGESKGSKDQGGLERNKHGKIQERGDKSGWLQTRQKVE